MIVSPSGMFITFEVIINISLMLEVFVRIMAQRKAYFRFAANIIDVLIVFFCIATLSLLSKDCTVGAEVEKAIDSALLLLRYVIVLCLLGNHD